MLGRHDPDGGRGDDVAVEPSGPDTMLIQMAMRCHGPANLLGISTPRHHDWNKNLRILIGYEAGLVMRG